jgi:HAD superfamily hydrolase (TIGR01662 family)
MSQRAAFLDRDGVINAYVYNSEFGTVDSPANPDEFALLPGAAEAITKLNEAGLLAIVVSNQPGIAKGRFTLKLLETMTEKMKRLVAGTGGRLDAVYYCPPIPKAQSTATGSHASVGSESWASSSSWAGMGDRPRPVVHGRGRRGGCTGRPTSRHKNGFRQPAESLRLFRAGAAERLAGFDRREPPGSGRADPSRRKRPQACAALGPGRPGTRERRASLHASLHSGSHGDPSAARPTRDRTDGGPAGRVASARRTPVFPWSRRGCRACFARSKRLPQDRWNRSLHAHWQRFGIDGTRE